MKFASSEQQNKHPVAGLEIKSWNIYICSLRSGGLDQVISKTRHLQNLDVDLDADFVLINLLECLEERKLGSPLKFHTRRL